MVLLFVWSTAKEDCGSAVVMLSNEAGRAMGGECRCKPSCFKVAGADNSSTCMPCALLAPISVVDQGAGCGMGLSDINGPL